MLPILAYGSSGVKIAKLSTPVVIIRSGIEYLSIIGCYLCNTI